MSEKNQRKKTRELQILEAYLNCQGISYDEIRAGEAPDFLVKLNDSNHLRYELVEITDQNERSVMGRWTKHRAKLDAIHVHELNTEFAEQFNSGFCDAVFKLDITKTTNQMQNAYKAFLINFKVNPDNFRGFAGDPNASKEQELRGMFEISRTNGLTTKPSAMASGASFWVDQTYKAVTDKFLKPYAADSDVTILAFWKPQFVPGDPAGVKAQLEAMVRSASNKNDIRIVGFDMLNSRVFFEHPA